MPHVAWLDGEVIPFERATVPIEDRGLQLAESLYEVIAIADGRARLLGEHATRMRAGAQELELQTGVPDEAGWAQLVDALLARDAVVEGLLYAQLTGGEAPRSHLPETPPTPTFFAYVRSRPFPRAPEVDRGVRTISMPDPRWQRCDLKTTMLLPSVLAKREAARQGADEVLFVGPDGELREGGSSNVIAVEGDTLVTPAQTPHLLPGITRPMVGRVAAQAGLAMSEEVVSRERLLAADEAFVVSTAQLVMPVLEVDGARIGDGRAGAVARDLARRLRAEWGLEP